MDIMTFRILKENMLEKLTPGHRERAENHINYALTILDQEVMSMEAVAVIITCTK